MSETTEPGWYDDGTGTMRWWDGDDWTDEVLGAEDAGTGFGNPVYGQPAASGYGGSVGSYARGGHDDYGTGYAGYGYDQGHDHGYGYGQGEVSGTSARSGNGALYAAIGGVALLAVLVLVMVLVLVNRDGGGGGGGGGDDQEASASGFDEAELDMSEGTVSSTLRIEEAGTYQVTAVNGYSYLDITLQIEDEDGEALCEPSYGDVVDARVFGNEECEADFEPGDYEVIVSDYLGRGTDDSGEVTLELEGP